MMNIIMPPITRMEAQNIVDTREFDGGDHGAQYQALFDFYISVGEMPYGVAKARDGDPHSWIIDQLEQELESIK